MKRLWIGLALLVAALLVKGVLVEPPSPPATVASDQFDASKAKDRLARIVGANRPHVTDSDANDEVRTRLVTELRALGLDPRVTRHRRCVAFEGFPRVGCATVRNVVVTVGSGDAPHLLVNSHYDSALASPGGADAGIGVASMLEIARLIEAEPDAGRPVTFLFNEGEELGLLGAHAFIAEDPAAEAIDSVINFEARGSDGPAIMFRTSTPNAGLIERYASATRRPVANSLGADIASLIPNYTDVRAFAAETDWQTVDFAVPFNEARYHSGGDTVDALSIDSLHHMGSEGLALTRAMRAPAPEAQGRALYSDIAGRLLFHLPLWIGTLFFLTALVLIAREWLHTKDRSALGYIALATGVGLVVSALAGFLLPFLRDGQFWRGTPIVPFTGLYLVGLAAVLALLLRRAATRETLRAASWLLLAILYGAGAILLPGVLSAVLPAALIAAIATFMRGTAREIAFFAAALLLFVMHAQTAAQVEEIMIYGPIFAATPLILLGSLPLLVEMLPNGKARNMRAAAALAAGGLGLLVAALLIPQYSERSPMPLSFVREVGADGSPDHLIAINDSAPLPETIAASAGWKPIDTDFSSRKRLGIRLGDHDPLPLRIERLAEREIEGGREIDLRITSDADQVTLSTEEESAITAMGFLGNPQQLNEGNGDTLIRCTGRECRNFRLTIVTPRTDRFLVGVSALRWGLTGEAENIARLRPDTHVTKGIPDTTFRHVEGLL